MHLHVVSEVGPTICNPQTGGRSAFSSCFVVPRRSCQSCSCADGVCAEHPSGRGSSLLSQGVELFSTQLEKFYQFVWRPRPPTPLEEERSVLPNPRGCPQPPYSFQSRCSEITKFLRNRSVRHIKRNLKDIGKELDAQDAKRMGALVLRS